MFRKREIRISLAKTPKNDSSTEEIAGVVGESSARVVHDLAMDALKTTAFVIGGTIIAVTVVSAACQIAVKTTKTN